jgi:hypothetical protein
MYYIIPASVSENLFHVKILTKIYQNFVLKPSYIPQIVRFLFKKYKAHTPGIERFCFTTSL